MATERGNLVIGPVAAGLVIALVSLVVPWWTVTGAAGGFSGEASASPFADGGVADPNGAVAVGVLCIVAIVAIAGGGTLLLRARQTGEEAIDPAAWLVIAGGGLYLIAALVAVFTWPDGDQGFWASGSAFGATFGAAASAGWYLAVLAGGMVGAGGLFEAMGEEEDGDVAAGPVDTADGPRS